MNQQLFRFSSIKNDDVKIAFYTGFPTYSCIKAFFQFLEPAASELIYSKKQEVVLEQEKQSAVVQDHYHRLRRCF